MNIYCDLDGTFIVENSMKLQWVRLNYKRKFLLLAQSMGKKWKLKLLLTEETVGLSFHPTVSRKVLNYLIDARKEGAQLVLATAAESRFAERLVDEYLPFDKYLGTRYAWHNKGKRKAMDILNDAGAQKFIYIGDSLSDFAIWRYATIAICTKNNFRIRFISKVKGVQLCMF